VRFRDEPGRIITTHKQNVYRLADAERLHVDVGPAAVPPVASTPPIAEPAVVVGELVREVREEEGMAIRELARRSDLSPALLSRLERGEMKRSSPTTIATIARALGRHPLPLLVAARVIVGDDAHTQLLELLQTAENADVSWDPSRFETHLANVDTDAIAEIAGEMFLVAGDTGLPSESYQQALGAGTPSPELSSLLARWGELTVDRRGKVLEFATEQAQLSRLDREGML
jgi:transcriptional regulator with XRE-family HTH domain